MRPGTEAVPYATASAAGMTPYQYALVNGLKLWALYGPGKAYLAKQRNRPL